MKEVLAREIPWEPSGRGLVAAARAAVDQAVEGDRVGVHAGLK